MADIKFATNCPQLGDAKWKKVPPLEDAEWKISKDGRTIFAKVRVENYPTERAIRVIDIIFSELFGHHRPKTIEEARIVPGKKGHPEDDFALFEVRVDHPRPTTDPTIARLVAPATM